jgi:cytochrome c biogenesis protein
VATFIPAHVVQAFTGRLSPPAAKVFLFFRLSDLYHSPLFYFLMTFLSLNLIICSINRFPALWRQYKAPHFPEPDGIFDNLPHDRIIMEDKEITDIKPIVESCLGKKYGSVKKADIERGTLYYVERWRFSLFGVYIVHLSILAMIAGAIIGSIFGMEADINIKEGETVDVASLEQRNGIQKLNFSVRCDKFVVEFYEDGTPKTYRSDLSFIKNGQVEKRGTLLVNHPLTFENLRFYQSSYGAAPDSKAIVVYSTTDRKIGAMALAAGDTFDLPQGKAKGFVLRVEDNIMQMGPAIKLRITSPQKDIQFWVFKNIDKIVAANPNLLKEVPMFNPGLFKPFIFSIDSVEQTYYTGLHIVHDPGVPLVAVGGLLMIAGLIIIFFMAYQRFWVRIGQVETKIIISIAGRSNRKNEQLQKKTDYLCRRIQKEIKA